MKIGTFCLTMQAIDYEPAQIKRMIKQAQKLEKQGVVSLDEELQNIHDYAFQKHLNTPRKPYKRSLIENAAQWIYAIILLVIVGVMFLMIMFALGISPPWYW